MPGRIFLNLHVLLIFYSGVEVSIFFKSKITLQDRGRFYKYAFSLIKQIRKNKTIYQILAKSYGAKKRNKIKSIEFQFSLKQCKKDYQHQNFVWNYLII